MRILCLANNYVGKEIVAWLKKQHEGEIIGLVVHPFDKQKHVDEIISESGLPTNRIFFGDSLGKQDILRRIRELKPDIAISIYFGYILTKEFIEIFPQGCINLHPAYLPYNRGAYPNVWSIIDGTPAGSTLHYVNEKIDLGDIIAQSQVPVTATDTGCSLYKKLEHGSISLFKENWLKILAGDVKRQPQNSEEGSYHKLEDISKIDEIDLDKIYKARDLINIIRARTFPPYNGAFIVENGERKYMRLNFFNCYNEPV